MPYQKQDDRRRYSRARKEYIRRCGKAWSRIMKEMKDRYGYFDDEMALSAADGWDECEFGDLWRHARNKIASDVESKHSCWIEHEDFYILIHLW